MDPDATLKLLLEATVEKNGDDVRELSRALLDWLDSGGFPPKTIGPWKLGQDWHVSMARHICATAESSIQSAESLGK